MKDQTKKLLIILTLLAYISVMVLGSIYLYTNQLSFLLFALLMLFISNILFSIQQLKYGIIHLLFYITLFIFLISRPTIDYLKMGTFNTYQRDAYIFAFVAVGISLVGLLLGGILGKSMLKVNTLKMVEPENTAFLMTLQKVALTSFCLTYPFYVLRLLERLLFRMNTSYYEYYAEFQSKLPYITYLLSAFTTYAFCLYLATKPKKKPATIVLIAYTLANGIHLLIGTRNPFILSLLFAFVYYFLRHQEMKETWLGFKEKMALSISIPVLMIAMGILNYVRDAVNVKSMSFFDLMIDFVYKQGTSFGVLARGYLFNSNLPVKPFANFTFGPIIEYFSKGTLGIYLFGAKPFTTTSNSLEMALESNSYSHNISYIVLKEDYLAGHGIGGSYIMDIFTDYGYLGIFLMSCLLGFIFIWLLKKAYTNHVVLFTMGLIILNHIFFMPRSSFSESFFYLFTIQFWIFIISILCLAKWLTPKTTLKNLV